MANLPAADPSDRRVEELAGADHRVRNQVPVGHADGPVLAEADDLPLRERSAGNVPHPG